MKGDDENNLTVNTDYTSFVHPATLSLSCLPKVDTGVIGYARAQTAEGGAGFTSKHLQFNPTMADDLCDTDNT